MLQIQISILDTDSDVGPFIIGMFLSLLIISLLLKLSNQLNCVTMSMLDSDIAISAVLKLLESQVHIPKLNLC